MYVQDTGSTVQYASTAALWMQTLIAYQAQVATIRLCPSTATTNNTQGTVKLPWYWGSAPNAQLNVGSYAINGWLYRYDPNGDIAQWVPTSDAGKFFQKSSFKRLALKNGDDMFTTFFAAGDKDYGPSRMPQRFGGAGRVGHTRESKRKGLGED